MCTITVLDVKQVHMLVVLHGDIILNSFHPIVNCTVYKLIVVVTLQRHFHQVY